MQLFLHRDTHPNFGDELNAWLMPLLFGETYFDDKPPLFLAIGSILEDRHPITTPKIVFGSGYGGYYPLPVIDGTWKIYCVRGPRTAAAIGAPPELGICDPAILVRQFRSKKLARRYPCSFMPHYESVERGNWQRACALANIHFIDPRDPIHTVMDEIQGSGLLLSEAMHGAIVADALRTPWVALKPTDRAHHMKWDDWATSLGIVLRFRSLPFSTFQEARLRWSGVDRAAPKAGLKGAAASVVDEAGLRLAARALRTAAAGPPQLSDESMLEQRTSALLDVVQRIRTDYR